MGYSLSKLCSLHDLMTVIVKIYTYRRAVNCGGTIPYRPFHTDRAQTVAFASQLKTFRMKKGLSLQVLADAVGISKAHLWDMESGRSANPSMDLLKKLSEQLNVSISVLVGEEPSADTPETYKAMFRSLQDLKPEDLSLVDAVLKNLKQRKSDGDHD